MQFFFAALYAFVLPFICAGAQATPGHPHARAHFVFVEPEMADHKMLSFATDMAAAPQGQMTSHDADCYLHHAHGPTVSEAQPPAGRSVPMQLVISGLLPIGTVALTTLSLADPTGFSVWLAESVVPPFQPLVPTPPPR